MVLGGSGTRPVRFEDARHGADLDGSYRSHDRMIADPLGLIVLFAYDGR